MSSLYFLHTIVHEEKRRYNSRLSHDVSDIQDPLAAAASIALTAAFRVLYTSVLNLWAISTCNGCLVLRNPLGGYYDGYQKALAEL